MKSSLATKPLSDAIGIEITGLDLRTPLNATQEAALRSLMDEHHLLMFRGQQIEGADQVRVLKTFGPVQDEVGDGSCFTYVSNVRKDGLFGDLPLIFHSDFAFGEYLPPANSLYGIEIGKRAGPTSFANCVRACRQLPEALRAEIADKTVVQVARFAGGTSTAAGDNRGSMLGIRQMSEDSKFRKSHHPVLKPHPRTGALALFVSEKHTSHIEGIDRERSDTLVKDLLARLYAPDNVYTHNWSVGDLIIWDNVAVQHGRPALGGSGGDEYKRTLRRVLVSEKTMREMVGADTYQD
jgi:taurine dioxygenase